MQGLQKDQMDPQRNYLFQKSLTGIKNLFLFRVPMNPQKDWKAKLERPHFLKVQPGKITVCPEPPKNSQETPEQSSDNSDDSIVILDDTPPPPPKSLETKKEPLNPMNNSMSEILTQLEHNQQQQQKLIKLLSTTGGGVMLPDKGAKLKRDLQHVKDRRVVLKENLEQKMNRSKEKGNLNLLIK